MDQECSVVADCVLWPQLPDVLFMVLRFCLFVHAFAHRERLLSSTNMLPCSPQNLNMDDTVCRVNADLLTVAGTGKGVTAEFIGNGRHVKINVKDKKIQHESPPPHTHTSTHKNTHDVCSSMEELLPPAKLHGSQRSPSCQENRMQTLMTSPWAKL